MTDPNPSEAFWDKHYRSVSPESSGRPSTVLTRFVEGRPPGHALDLGCAKGDDTVWLARNGWQVTAVDVSETVLGYARRNAKMAGLEDRMTFARHDLGQDFPAGKFDLVSATFLHSPVDFPRMEVLQRAAASVASKGLFVIASHGSVAPWSWAEPGTVFPAAEETFDDLRLEAADWRQVFVGPSVRAATGPGGQTAKVTDALVVLERR